MTSHKQLWEQALAEIEFSTSRANFNTWFRNTFISRCESGSVQLCVPNAFVRDWLSSKYHKDILRALRNNSPSVRTVEYVISKEPQKQKGEQLVREEEVRATDQLALKDLAAATTDGLNSRYDFETFIVGPFNELAHAAAQAIVKNPGMSYNPLFVYGGTGLGKTHLLQAVGNQIKKNFRDKQVNYVTTETFTQDYIDAVQNNKMRLFKEKYRKYDFLIMDDVQFISGKEKTQEELFHLFNFLYDANKQIIFSSDKPPAYITNLEDRLRSRFEGGMIVDISKPDYESRLAIIREKAQKSEFTPSQEVLSFVAESVSDNIRELEGILNAIVYQSTFRKRDLTLPEIKQIIKNNTRPQKTLSIRDVIRTVAEYYQIDERVLYEKTRRKEVVKPRQVVMYILREDLNTSYPYIGQKMGGRDHTTVIHAYEKIKRDIKEDTLLNEELRQIKNVLYNTAG